MRTDHLMRDNLVFVDHVMDPEGVDHVGGTAGTTGVIRVLAQLAVVVDRV